ncbi:MAG: carboxypeptidase-like regulatory domain-containing protein [Acidobacteriia bacterium]|nr:carboxypeptidase-like regulatory domain-containing protein [Terriglobia bacterium]
MGATTTTTTTLEKRIETAFGLLTCLALALCLTMLCSAPAKAQVSGATMSGLITDPSGAGIPNANVSIKNTGTGEVREVPTNANGFYSAPNLLPGKYEATITAQGFNKLVQKGITLSVGEQQALNLSLKVGQVNQTMEVTAAPPEVQTSSSTISSTVDATTVRELPLNGRDWTSLAALEPGVSSIQNQVGTGFSANKGNRGFGNQLSNGGHRANENTYRINGVAINDYSNGAPGGASGLNLGVDGIQEFSVLTSDYTAEYGRTSGAVINAITKSGVNELHGTAFFFDRDKVFDAKNFFDSASAPIPPFRRVQFGGSAGTALIKDKTFVYGTYEGVRQNRPVSQLITVPSDAERALAVPAVAPYMKLWPEAPAGTAIDSNGVTQTFGTAFPSISNENYFTGRVDQKIGKSDTLAGSYFWDSGPQSQEDPLQNTTHQVFSRRQMASVEETHTFSSALVNAIRGGISRVRGDINTPVSGHGAAIDPTLAIAPGAAAPPQIAVGGPTHITTAIGLGGLNRFLHRWTSGQFYDDAFLTHGTHSIKMGFAFERMRYNVTEKLSPNGRMNTYKSLDCLLGLVDPDPTHNCLTPDPINGNPNQLNALAPGGSHEVQIRQSLVAGYLQDDWRARPNLTVNLGLRYEFTTLPNDAGNNIQEITTLVNCATPGVLPSPSSPCGPQHVGSFIASNPTTKNFEPRIGFSYDPFKDSKTAIRGGFGMFDVLPLPYEFGLNTAATYPFQIVGADPNVFLGSGIDPNVSFVLNNVRNRYVQQDPKRALVMNWNFNIQREVASNTTFIIGYVGSRSTHLSVAADDINLVPPVLTPQGIVIPLNTYQVDPNWAHANGGLVPGGPGGSGIRPVLFDGESTYHGLQAQLKKTMSYGFQGQISYTWSKCRDTSSAPVTGDTYSTSIAVPLLLSKQYRIGACDFDLRHVAVGTLIWDVPGPKSGAMSWVAGGWELGTIVTATTGSPFSVTIGGGGDPLNTGFNGDFSMDFPDLIPGCNATPGVFRNAQGKLEGFNPACFATPPNVAGGTLVGNAGRNRFYGPGLKSVDFSVFKNLPLTERLKAQFRAEFFNVLNHPNFASPNFLNDGNMDASDGVLASTSTLSRQIQLGLKLIW